MIKLRLYPDPILTRRAKRIDVIDGKIKYLAEAMLDIMHEHNGIGLAAPQVGESLQMFVMVSTPCDKVFINPVINRKWGADHDFEGCLSIPGVTERVIRARHCIVEGYTLFNDKIEFKVHGLEARVWQHEVNHLHGKLFIERFSPAELKQHAKALRLLENNYKQKDVPVI